MAMGCEFGGDVRGAAATLSGALDALKALLSVKKKRSRAQRA
jgi:hypothetical protein